MRDARTSHVRSVAVPLIMYGTAWKEDRTQALTLEAIATGFRCRRNVCWNLLGAVSGWMRILDQAARSIGLSASFWFRVCHPSTLRMVI